MKNYIQVGDTVTVIAPSGGIQSGQSWLVGELLFGVSVYDADTGAEAELCCRGVFELPKTGVAVAVGDGVYARFAAAPGTPVTVEGTGALYAQTADPLIGVAVTAASEDAATVRVRIG